MVAKPTAKMIQEWNRRLSDSGFEDIEYFSKAGNSDQTLLKNSGSDMIRRYDPFKEQYYYYCSWFLEHYEFESEVDRQVWRLHTDGVSYKNITNTLKEAFPNKSITFSKVNSKIISLRAVMKEKVKHEYSDQNKEESDEDEEAF